MKIAFWRSTKPLAVQSTSAESGQSSSESSPVELSSSDVGSYELRSGELQPRELRSDGPRNLDHPGLGAFRQDRNGWVRAVVNLPIPIVLLDSRAEPVYFSSTGEPFVRGTANTRLSRDQLERVVDNANLGIDVTEVEVFGSVRRQLRLTASQVEMKAADSVVAELGPRTEVEIWHFVTIDDLTAQSVFDTMRTDLLANIGHELRTPVGAISLLAETIGEEQDIEVARRLAKRIEVESERLGATVNGVLALSRLEQTNQHANNRIGVNALVRRAVDQISLNTNAGERLVVRPWAGEIYVNGDEHLLQLAVSNLIDNALKYSADDESVSVSVSPVLQNRDDLGPTVSIAVSDNGIGIPPRERQRIFERFYRVDRSRSTNAGGVGLGLALVRQIVVSHDGTVTVESGEGFGSTFTIHLPVSGEASPIQQKESR